MKHILITLLFAFMSLNVFASRARSRALVDRLKQEIKTGKRVTQAELDMHQRRFEQDLMVKLRKAPELTGRQVNISTLRSYVKANQNNPQNIEAIYELIKNITARGNVVPAQQNSTASLLAQAMVMQKKGGFMLEARDILEIDRNWTVKEKDMLGDVVAEARQLMKEDISLTADMAFEKALGNRGLLEKFKRRCT